MRQGFAVFVMVTMLFPLCAYTQTPETDRVRPSTTSVPVFAHFAGWWTVPGSWATAATMPLRSDNPGGGYTSANPEIIRQQNAEMIANGIRPLVSWWERDSYAGDAFLDAYLAQSGPQIGILYEAVGPGRMQPNASGRIDVNDLANANIFINDMEYLQKKYFDRYPERFCRIDGRPVVFIWISHAFDGAFDRVIAQARERSSFYLIGSDFMSPFAVRKGAETVIRGMDAITAYGFYDQKRYGADMPEQFLTDFASSVSTWQGWLSQNAPGVHILLPMQFAYDDTRIPGRKAEHFGSSFEMARRYAEKVRGLALNPCVSRILPYVYVTSYTEHAEGSAIEPTREFGSGYLDIVRETFLSVAVDPSRAREECVPEDAKKE
jgi:hypothetical protein